MSSWAISACRITQERAGVSEIDTACRDDPETRLADLMADDAVAEAFVLQTCLRAELYVVAETAAAGREALSTVDLGVPDEAVVSTGPEESLRHLFRVTAGLESFVVGEDQILGQVQTAIETADTAGCLGPVLKKALSKAVQVGERARTETAINDGPTSIGGAAVSLVERERDLTGGRILVIGTGEMGTHIAQAISLRGEAELLLANRTRWSADRLAERLDTAVSVVPFDAIPSRVSDVEVVISATASAEPILGPDSFSNTERTLVVDIGRPRDVAPGANDCEQVVIYDMDTLESITERARETRHNAVEHVETMIDNAIPELLEQYKRQRVDAVVAAMYRGAERIKRRELETATSKLECHGGLTDDQLKDVEALADVLVSELLAAPIRALRDAAANDDWRTISTAIELFDPDIEPTGSVEDDPLRAHVPTSVFEPASAESQDDD